MTPSDFISNAYQGKRELFNPAIEKFIRGFTPGKFISTHDFSALSLRKSGVY